MPELSIPVMLAGLAGVFVFGIAFDVFGNTFNFSGPGTYLFFGSIWFSVFGLALAFLTVRGAFIAMVCTAMLFLLIFTAGKLSRGEL